MSENTHKHPSHLFPVNEELTRTNPPPGRCKTASKCLLAIIIFLCHAMWGTLNFELLPRGHPAHYLEHHKMSLFSLSRLLSRCRVAATSNALAAQVSGYIRMPQVTTCGALQSTSDYHTGLYQRQSGLKYRYIIAVTLILEHSVYTLPSIYTFTQ